MSIKMKNKDDTDNMEQLFRAAMLEIASKESDEAKKEVLNPVLLPSKKLNRKIERMLGITAEKRNWKLSFQKLYAGYSRVAGGVVIAVFLIYLFFPRVVQNMLTNNLIKNNPGYAQLVLSQTNYPYNPQLVNITQIPIANQAVTVYNTNFEVVIASDSYQLSYLPDGFGLTQVETSDLGSAYRFQNTNGMVLAFEIFDSNDMDRLEKESQANSIEYVNDKKAFYSYSAGVSTLTWTSENHTFLVNADLSKEELLKIARGITNN